MKIRRLEIQGFKSFMDRAKMRFDDGITGIVGPNGCGKSNVVDAIRWVMGEQSARILRGKSMEDVIFAGSETKPPMGMAEVQITFENDGRNIPPEYAAYSEITVGRRLFRSGESEYLINRTPCRLLDVQDLFMGTGVGTRAYSIIGQGQIGLLVTQKPQDRRSLIEEAAGISKYKARKKVAERKMELTQQNLLRVNDIVAEIKRNIDSLQRQARKAARYNKIRDQVREIEMLSAAHRYLELHSVQRHLRNKQSLQSSSETALQAQVARMEASVEQKRLMLLEEDKRISELQESLLSTDNQIRLNEQNVEFIKRELDSLSSRSQASAQEVDALHLQAEQATAGMAKAKEQLQELHELAESASRRLQGQEQEHQAQSIIVEELGQGIDQNRQELLHLGEHVGESRSHVVNLEQRLLDLQGRYSQREAEQKTLRDRIVELQDQKQHQTQRLGQLKQMHLDFIERREAEENTLEELQSKAAENEAKGLALREEISNKRSRLESLLQIERSFEGCLSGVRCVMQKAQQQESNNQVVGLVADILQAPSRYETAVQAVLGDRLQSVVVRSQEAGLAAVDYLKTEAEGRSSFIPLSLREPRPTEDLSRVQGTGVIGPMHSLLAYQQEYGSIVRYLLGDVVVVEDLPSAMSIWTANGHKATLVTLDGDVLEPEGVLSGGSLEGSGTQLLANKREIRELQERLRDIEAAYRLVQDSHGKIKAQLASTGSSINNLRQSSHDEEIRIVDQEKDLNHLQHEFERLSARADEIAIECRKLEVDLADCKNDKAQTQKRVEEAVHRQAEIESLIRSQRERLDQEKQTLAALSQELLDLKVQAAASLERKESATRHSENLRASREDLQKRIERLRQELSAGNLQAIEGKTRIEESRNEISRLITQREQEQSRLGAARDGYERLLAETRAEEMQGKDSRRELDQLLAQASDNNLRLREIEMDLAHLVETIQREHKLDLVANLAAYHLQASPTQEDLHRVQKLRIAMENMGDVNPNAVEAYEELKKRYEFLTAQSTDLTDSLQKLQSVIQKINRASRKRFKEAFDAINGKFQEIFPRLFNGGRAHLALEENLDLLEAGVDIVAQPPGKKLQNIELLSGGEKALTAVALLFSIFLVKPTPFCLLDEVDAPLDDLNIDRFNHMIKEMSGSSQFILITHSKRTMELLDQLYGVTMEEPGISTVVNVRFKDQSGIDVTQAA